MTETDASHEELTEAMKKASAALRDAGIPHALAGGLAAYARGAPESDHDVDFLVKPEDADRAWHALGDAGMRMERPPEPWLLKAYDGEALVDLIFEPAGGPVTDELLERAEEAAERIAERHHRGEFFLYLGRHVGLAVGLEGALKLKEVSYIATDAYAAGEMKHGPIALLGEATPVVVVATDSPVLDKVVSNVQEVRARGARTIVIATDGDESVTPYADHVITIPDTKSLLTPLLTLVPMQVLSAEIARARGLDVDQPRNLAKSVTVE